MEIIKEASPHIRRRDSLNRMMVDLLIGLSPVLVFAFAVYQLAAVRNLFVSVGAMVAAEFVYVLIVNRLPKDGKKHSLGEKLRYGASHYRLSNFLVPTVSGLLYGLITPACFASVWTGSYWAVANPYNPLTDGYAYFVLIAGALFGLVVGKLVFGGTGHNIFNPAAAGFIFAKECFGSRYRVANYFDVYFNNITDVQTGGTFLNGSYSASASYSNYSLLDLLLGRTPGLMGEVCKVAILIGLAYLLIRHTIDWRITLSFLGTFVFLMFFAGLVVNSKDASIGVFPFVGYQLLSGGVLFGAVYMITDPVTSPMTSPSRVLYGTIIASSTVLIRLLGRSDYVKEGMCFSILLGNMVSPALDYYKWSTSKFTVKNLIPMVVIPLVALAVILWALGVSLPIVSSGSGSSSAGGSSASGSTSSGTDASAGGTTKAVIAGLPFLRGWL
jgi:electron transport complex protein RnfD